MKAGKAVWLVIMECKHGIGYTAHAAEATAWKAAATYAMEGKDEMAASDREGMQKAYRAKDWKKVTEVWGEALEMYGMRTTYVSVEKLTLRP